MFKRKMAAAFLIIMMLCILTACQNQDKSDVDKGKPRTPKTENESTPTPTMKVEEPTPTIKPDDPTPTPTMIPATPTPTVAPTPSTPVEIMKDSLGVWVDSNEWFISLKENADGKSLIITTGYRYDSYFEKSVTVDQIENAGNSIQIKTADDVIMVSQKNSDGGRTFFVEGKNHLCTLHPEIQNPYSLKEMQVTDFMYLFEGYYVTTSDDMTDIDIFSYGDGADMLQWTDFYGRYGSAYIVKQVLVSDNESAYYLKCDTLPEAMDDGPTWVRWEDLGGNLMAYSSSRLVYRQVTWAEYEELTFPTLDFILDLYQKNPDSALEILSNYHARMIADRWEDYIVEDDDIFVTYQKPGGPALKVMATDDYIVVKLELK